MRKRPIENKGSAGRRKRPRSPYRKDGRENQVEEEAAVMPDEEEDQDGPDAD